MVDLSESIEFKSEGISEKKTQIILSETKRSAKNYINSLKYRYNGKNPYIPNYVIDKEGEIYKILDDKKYSKYMDSEVVNKRAVIVVLENYGWLLKNALENTYVNYVGDIYKKDIFKKKWRDHDYWDKYEEKQINVLSELLSDICNKMNIEKECIGTNVRYNEVTNFKGIVSKSNYDFIYKDLNPSFNFELLTKLLKNE
jgi:isopropylmalate/homocitrate/citramalate synthase